jgi:hypothetical protein
MSIYSPFCVPANVTKLIGLQRPPFLSPTNLIIFACTQNGELKNNIITVDFKIIDLGKKNPL